MGSQSHGGVQRRVIATLSCLALTAGLAAVASAAGIERYSPVTDARLVAPEPENWLHYRGTYNAWGFSPLDQINTSNVKNLRPVWAFSTGLTEGHQAPPIVNDGIMYVAATFNVVFALDAKTGELLWKYKRELPADLAMLHPTTRGVGLYEDKVYLATLDCFLVALDAKTGEVVWEKKVEDYKTGYYMTLAPLVAKGKVLVGVSGGERGIRGFVEAFDAKTGASVWKTYTVPSPDQPGGDTWPGDTWQRGAGSIWITGSYDPALNLTYWGVGNGGPWMGDQRPGDNLYTASVIAMDIDTGEIKHHFQYSPNESWDWDEVSDHILVDIERNGKKVQAAVHAARNGYLYVLDRTDLSFEYGLPYVKQDVFRGLDPVTGRPDVDPAKKPGTGKPARFCPSLWGGKDWPPFAYNPETQLLYIPANENLCSSIEGTEVTYRPGQSYTGARSQFFLEEGADHIGELQAWDLNTGRKVWTYKFPNMSPTWGPVLTTGGGLVFTGGTSDRYFRAFDAKTGELLWSFPTNSGITGVPVSFAVDGVQYIAVQSGWGVDAQRMHSRLAPILGHRIDSVPQGGAIWVFAVEQ